MRAACHEVPCRPRGVANLDQRCSHTLLTQQKKQRSFQNANGLVKAFVAHLLSTI